MQGKASVNDINMISGATNDQLGGANAQRDASKGQGRSIL
jgi:hypothetical protein